MSAARRFLLLLDVALLIAWVTFAITTYDRLPDTIPTHFGPSGTADAWSARSVGSWFVLPAIGMCTTLFMLGMAQLSFGRPAMYNVPGKEELLALPAAAQQPFVEQLAMFMTLMGTSVLLLFVALHYDAWRVAMGAQRGLSMISWAAIGLSLGGTTLALPIWMLRFKRGVTAAHVGSGRSHRRAS